MFGVVFLGFRLNTKHPGKEDQGIHYRQISFEPEFGVYHPKDPAVLKILRRIN